MLRQPANADLAQGDSAAAQPAAGPARAGGRALVFVAIVASAFTLRLGVTSLTPLLGDLKATFGFSSAFLGVFGVVPVAMFGLTGMITPTLVVRFGLERIALAGAMLITAGLAGRGFAGSAREELCWYAAALAGMGMGNVVTPPLVKRYFPDRIARVSTWYTMAVQVGAVLPPLVVVQLAAVGGWRVAVSFWAVLTLCVVPLLLVVVLRAQGVDHTAGAGDRVPLRALARSKRAWGMMLLFGTTSLISYAIMTWLPQRLISAGLAPQQGGVMLALFSLAGMAGPVAALPLLPRLRSPLPIVLAGGVCNFAGLAGLLWAPASGTTAWVVLSGLGSVTFPVCLALIGLRTRTSEHAAALSGFAQGFGYFLAMTGPFFFGVFRDLTGGWAASFGLLAVAAAGTVVGGWFASRPGYLEDELTTQPHQV